jgi:anti-sigma B factor antagonist
LTYRLEQARLLTLEAILPVGGSSPQGDLLECTVENDESVSVLRVRGEIDLATAPLLSQALARLLDEDGPVIVDLAGVLYCDVSGVRVFEHFGTLFSERTRHLVLASPSPIVRRIFGVIAFDAMPVLPTRAAALDFLKHSPA